MFSKVNLISTLITTIWGFFGGFLLWDIIGDSFLMEHLGTANAVTKEIPDMLFLVIGCLVVGFLFSHLFSNWSRGGYSVAQGAKFGITLGLLIGFGNGFIDYSTVGILDFTGTLVNGFIYVIHFMIMGILAGIIYKQTTYSSLCISTECGYGISIPALSNSILQASITSK